MGHAAVPCQSVTNHEIIFVALFAFVCFFKISFSPDPSNILYQFMYVLHIVFVLSFKSILKTNCSFVTQSV